VSVGFLYVYHSMEKETRASEKLLQNNGGREETMI